MTESLRRRAGTASPDDPAPASAWSRALAAARARYQGSLAQSSVEKLNSLEFSDQIMLLGAGLLVSLLPFLILLSAFAGERIDDDISLRMGLDRRASGIMTHLITTSPASLNFATGTSLLFVALGTLAVASSLQQIYEKVFGQQHRGVKDLYRLLIWVVALCLVIVLDSVIGGLARQSPVGGWLSLVVTFALMTAFFWWTMHFLLAGRVGWRRLLPSAVLTGLFFAVLGAFSKFYFSGTIISDDRTYGAIGAVFDILTWFVAVAAVIILGPVAGVVWQDRRK